MLGRCPGGNAGDRRQKDSVLVSLPAHFLWFINDISYNSSYNNNSKTRHISHLLPQSLRMEQTQLFSPCHSFSLSLLE